MHAIMDGLFPVYSVLSVADEQKPRCLLLVRFVGLALLTALLTPLLALLAATLLFFNAIYLATRFTRKAAVEQDAPGLGGSPRSSY